LTGQHLHPVNITLLIGILPHGSSELSLQRIWQWIRGAFTLERLLSGAWKEQER
jgi:hypothetical protein